jgi:hypothetical protein
MIMNRKGSVSFVSGKTEEVTVLGLYQVGSLMLPEGTEPCFVVEKTDGQVTTVPVKYVTLKPLQEVV